MSDSEKTLDLVGKTKIRFSSVKRGRNLIITPDDYTKALSPIDLKILLQTNKAVSLEDFFSRIQQQVLQWEEDEIEGIQHIVKELQDSFQNLNLKLPDTIDLVKTTGNIYPSVAYTRANYIVFCESMLYNPYQLYGLFPHEVFHVFTRNNPEIRDPLFKRIGFEKKGPLQLSEDLAYRRIANPDAPTDDYCIDIIHNHETVTVFPYLHSESTEYYQKYGGLFSHFVFKLLVVEKSGDVFVPKLQDGEPILIEATAKGYLDKIGRNTNYVIHPEEIIAKNFEIVIHDADETADDPQLVSDIRQILIDNQ